MWRIQRLIFFSNSLLRNSTHEVDSYRYSTGASVEMEKGQIEPPAPVLECVDDHQANRTRWKTRYAPLRSTGCSVSDIKVHKLMRVCRARSKPPKPAAKYLYVSWLDQPADNRQYKQLTPNQSSRPQNHKSNAKKALGSFGLNVSLNANCSTSVASGIFGAVGMSNHYLSHEKLGIWG